MDLFGGYEGPPIKNSNNSFLYLKPKIVKYFSDFPNELGVDAAPQLQTNVELQEVDHVRLPAPFLSRCFGNWSQTNYTNLSG